MQGLGKKKDNHLFVSQSDKNVNHTKSFQFSHCGQWHWNLNSSRSLSPEAREYSTVIVKPLLRGIRDLHYQWHPSYLVSSRGILGPTPGSERWWGLVATDLLGSFLICHIPPLSFPLHKLFSPRFLFFFCLFCFYHLTLSMTYSSACSHLLKILSPEDTCLCPRPAPHAEFYSRLINLFFFKLPLSDVDSNEEGMRAGKNTFLPSFLKLLRHIKGTIIGNDMLSSSLRLPVLNIRTTDEIYKEINCKLFNEEYQMITMTNGCAFL